MNVDLVRVMIAELPPEKRRALSECCTKLVLSTLLPPPPTAEAVANAKVILHLIEEVDAVQGSSASG